MTAREEWDALDAPEPVATPVPGAEPASTPVPTSLRAEWDALDAPEATATADRSEWNALDATPQPSPTFRPTSSFTNVESGGSADTAKEPTGLLPSVAFAA